MKYDTRHCRKKGGGGGGGGDKVSSFYLFGNICHLKLFILYRGKPSFACISALRADIYKLD